MACLFCMYFSVVYLRHALIAHLGGLFIPLVEGGGGLFFY